MAEKTALLPIKTTLYRRRWLVLATYMLVLFVNTAIYTMFTPLVDMFVKVYKVDVIVVNLNSILMSLLYVPSNFLISNLLYKRMGLHWAVGIGCALVCVCLGCRVLINWSFMVAMAGAFFYRIAQPLLLNANTEVATNWFATNERTLAITLAASMESLGAGFGCIFPMFFVSPSDVDNPSLAREHIFNCCSVAAVVFSLFLGLSVLIFRGKPVLPPTFSAEVSYSEPVSVSIKALAKNKNFLLIANAFGTVYACVATFGQETAFLIAPFGFDADDNTILGACFAIFGLLGAGLIGFYVSNSKKYKAAQIGVCLSSLIVVIAFVLILPMGSKALLYFFSAVLGVCVMPIVAVALDFGCETTFPIPANNSSGVQIAYNQVVCTLLVLISSWILSDYSQSRNAKVAAMEVFTLLIGGLAVGCVSSIFTREDLRKTEYDRQHQSEESSVNDQYQAHIFRLVQQRGEEQSIGCEGPCQISYLYGKLHNWPLFSLRFFDNSLEILRAEQHAEIGHAYLVTLKAVRSGRSNSETQDREHNLHGILAGEVNRVAVLLGLNLLGRNAYDYYLYDDFWPKNG